jgi:chitin synthase
LCNGVTGSVSPYIILDSSNVTDPNAQYHDFRVFTNDSRPDWYFESMVQMRWNNRVGFVGYTPTELKNMANTGNSVGVYNGLVFDLTSYINNGPAVRAPSGMQAPSTDAEFMDPAVLDIFKFNSGKDITKQLDNLKIDRAVISRQKLCLRNLLVIGKVDNRN